LRAHFPYGKDRRAIPFQGRARCRSSVVEHSLGKGEVVSSILTGSTSKTKQTKNFLARALPFPLALEREQSVFPPAKLGENPGNLFGRRSLILSSTVLTPIRDRAARNSQPFCTRGWRKPNDQKVCRKAECRNNSASRDEATPEAVTVSEPKRRTTAASALTCAVVLKSLGECNNSMGQFHLKIRMKESTWTGLIRSMSSRVRTTLD
jgi:hypothetical protein